MTLAKIVELEALAKAADTDDLTADAAFAKRNLARALEEPATVLDLLSSARRLLEVERRIETLGANCSKLFNVRFTGKEVADAVLGTLREEG